MWYTAAMLAGGRAAANQGVNATSDVMLPLFVCTHESTATCPSSCQVFDPQLLAYRR
jgi:hypothetical protein